MSSRHLLAVVSAALLTVAHAQAALMLDFGETGAPAGELEPGFSAFQVTNATNYQEPSSTTRAPGWTTARPCA